MSTLKCVIAQFSISKKECFPLNKIQMILEDKYLSNLELIDYICLVSGKQLTACIQLLRVTVEFFGRSVTQKVSTLVGIQKALTRKTHQI